MNDVAIPIELISQARLGEKVSLERLTSLVLPPLRSYIYRRILDVDLTEDIAQESLLEMIRILDRLIC